MMRYLVAYALTAVIFFGCDFIWISTAYRPLYKTYLGDLLRDKPDYAVAGVFYIFYVAAIVYFAILPGLQANGSLTRVLINGAVLGLISYGTYDLTNQATLRGWAWPVTIGDMIWGGFATAFAAVLACWLSQKLGY